METFQFSTKPGTLSEIEDEKERLDAIAELNRNAASHKDDFEVPIYNVWKVQDKSNEVGHFGNTEVRWLDNLLYLYTKPFDVVIDPFAGGGSTIDACRHRLRRYYVSDRQPIIERANEIREHDVTTGLPKPPQWKDVKLVYLDPPYWHMSKTIASGVGLNNAWLAEQGMLSMKTLWSELAPLRRTA